MKTLLKVPFSEKDEARRLGARWDIARKTWFVEDMENLQPFLRWMSATLKRPTGQKYTSNQQNQKGRTA